MNKSLISLLLFAALSSGAFALTPVQVMPPGYNENFSGAEALRGPESMSEDECNAKPHAVWVKLGWASKACIRYFPSDDLGVSKDVMFYIHGDRSPASQSDADRAAFIKWYEQEANYTGLVVQAEIAAKDNGMAVVFLGRPGVFGSTGGGHMPQNFPLVLRTENETDFLSAAIDAIKAKYGYTRINISGQSGGGGIVGAMLTKGRTDIDCAVSSSGALSMATRNRDYMGRDYVTPGTYDPVDHISGVKADPNRRVFAVTDPQDRAASMRSQKEFVDKFNAKGFSMPMIFADAKWDRMHHSLGVQGMRVVGWCKAGMSDEQIQANVKANAPGIALAPWPKTVEKAPAKAE